VKAIFAEAVDQDFLAKDPARSLKTPSNLRESDKTTLTWDQLRSALAKLGLRDRILLKLDMTNALRPSELFGLKWKCFDANAPGISIQETTYKGKIRSFGKTRGSLTTVPIAGELAAELAEWRDQSKDPSPEAFIFPGRFGGFMDSSNFRHRVLHRLAEELELPKLTFQVIRRTIATLAQRRSGDDAALPNGYHDRCLYAGTPGRRAGDCQLDSLGVDGDWHKRAAIRSIRNTFLYSSEATSEPE
jgi:integrase